MNNSIENMKLIQEEKDSLGNHILEMLLENTKEHIDTLGATIKMLLKVIDAKDNYTLAHSYRVCDYSLRLGKSIGLSSEDLSILKFGALLHDIGKIEISGRILKKKGKLTEDEYEYIKLHTMLGDAIILGKDHLELYRDIVLHHHERIDGQGYPYGLKGEKIPLLARIVAIADSFDAMTSDRPYNQRKTIVEALEELERCSGTQFDKELVRCFVHVTLENEVTSLLEQVMGY